MECMQCVCGGCLLCVGVTDFMPRQWLTSFAFANFILATKCSQNQGSHSNWRPRTFLGHRPTWQMDKHKMQNKAEGFMWAVVDWQATTTTTTTRMRMKRRMGTRQTRQSLASTHLAKQLERLLHAHHEEIKTIQLLQQHHTGGRHAHRHHLPYTPSLEGGREFFQYTRSHLVDKLIPTDAARALA